MRIAKIEDLHCNAGWRDFSFLKVTTDEGLVGWSEFMENFGAEGLSTVIQRLGERIIGMDPRPVEKITAFLHGLTRQTPYGINQQAIAAIENALVDIKAKALGVPVYEMLGGPVRERLQLYWSHCGTWRVSFADKIKEWTGFEPIRSLADVERAGAEVARRGFKGLKTNIMRFDTDPPSIHMPGFNGPGWPALNIDSAVVKGLVAQMDAFRRGAGPRVGLHLDLNFNFKTEGYIRLAQALEPFDLVWLEIDTYDPAALAMIRRSARTRIASLESLYGRRQFRPFLEQQSVDVAIIDVAWNGILESMKIAAMADAYEVNVAPHNFNGHLGSLMSAHMCAAIPNFRVMEIDIEDVPWKDELVTPVPRIENGELLIPMGPGWGAEINEAVIRAHPPRR
ncbi:MAG: mandelate racemase/muconate lactonizing enzyme family protein, partial [Acetobacteraceae bacterium]|nr:mandelate racemase/muconate lactonizing enzyme family protein [Acetobacteraceae bacterium]